MPNLSQSMAKMAMAKMAMTTMAMATTGKATPSLGTPRSKFQLLKPTLNLRFFVDFAISRLFARTTLCTLLVGGSVFAASAAGASNAASAQAPAPAGNLGPIGLPAHLIAIPSGGEYYGPYVLVVDKSARTLDIWKSELDSDGKKKFTRVASHPADLGKNNGDKVSEGDAKTPEGIYFLLTKMEGPSLDYKLYGSRAYTTDYPNHFDVLDGKSGSGIWLHSVPDEVPLTRGSRGCVVVRNEIVRTLDPYIRFGRTPIVISEKIETRPFSDAVTASAKLEEWTDSWRKAWESKSFETYMSYYDADFKSMGMNKAQWGEYKARLNKEYGQLTIRLSQPLALEHRGRAIVRFVQNYASDKKADLGEKVLHLISRNGQWKILSETWRADESPAARAAVASTLGASQASH